MTAKWQGEGWQEDREGSGTTTSQSTCSPGSTATVMMAPYAIAHRRSGSSLRDRLPLRERRARDLPDNALEPAKLLGDMAFAIPAAAHEAEAVNGIKRDQPQVVIGNPPYSGHSSNRSIWINGLLDSYKAHN